jgi:hypothetical protein
MLKFFISLISSLLFFNACSIKNPLSKKSKITYIDCPKTLILAPGSKISNDQITMKLNKNYSMNCYLPEPESSKVVFEYNYTIETTFNNPSSEIEKVEFIVFVTNKTEVLKVHEETHMKDIEINLSGEDLTKIYTQISNFSDIITLDKKIYEDGVKAFLAIN